MDDHNHHPSSPGGGLNLQPPNSTSPMFSTATASSMRNRRPSAETNDVLGQSPAPRHELQRSTSAQSAASTSSLPQTPAERLTIHIVSPPLNFPVRKPPSRLCAKPHHTVDKLKRVICSQWPGRPAVEGIRLIHAGRILFDAETVQSIVHPGHAEAYVHLVVRPDAWTDAETAPLPSPSIHRAAPRPQLIRPGKDPLEGSSYFSLPIRATASPAASPPHLNMADVAGIPSLPRIIDIIDSLYYHRYTLLYNYKESSLAAMPAWQEQEMAWSAETSTSLGHSLQIYDEIEEVLFRWQRWPEHVSAMARSDEWASILLQTCKQRRVHLQTYIEQFNAARNAPHMSQGSIFSAHLGSPNVIAPATPQSAAAVQNPQPTVLQQQGAALAADQGQAAAAATLPPIPAPSLTEVVTMFLPVFFLAVKIGIILYIFTRGASSTKRAIMYGGSALYLLAEVFKAWSRRQRRLDSARRRAARAADRAARRDGPRGVRSSPGAHPNGETSEPAPANTAPTPGLPLAPVAPQRLTARSVTQYEWWLQRIAFFGLDVEDLEMGLRPHASQAHAWMIQVAREQLARRRQQARRGLAAHLWSVLDVTKIVNDGFYGAFLYFASLVPEVEEMRGEQVRKRDNLIRTWWNSKGKDWVERQKRERAERETEKQRRREAGEDDEADEGEDMPPQELPRLLRHPHVLKLLHLERSDDGLVRQMDGESSAAGGRQINIQEELDALRDMQRDNAVIGGNGAGGAPVPGAGAGAVARGRDAGGDDLTDEEARADEDDAQGDEMGFF